MFGILLVAISSAFGEISDSIGKEKTKEHAYSSYTFGFMSVLGGAVFLLIVALIRHDFVFSLASLPTFLPRVALEILQAHVTIQAIMRADRSDFGPLRTITIPLLLAVDLTLGYVVTREQMIGMAIISCAILALLSYEHFRTKGLFFILFTAVNAVVTISLFKYDITHFNSVDAEQLIIGGVLLIYFFTLAMMRAKENPLRLLMKPVFFAQTLVGGLGSLASSYAYVLAPASIITTAGRASTILFSLIAGRMYFHERGVMIKLLLFGAILVGLFLLI